MKYLAVIELTFIVGICILMLLKRDKQNPDWWLMGFFFILCVNDSYNVINPSAELHWIHLVTITLCPVFFRMHLLSLIDPLTAYKKLLLFLIPFVLLPPMMVLNATYPDNPLFLFYLFSIILVMIVQGVIALVLSRQSSGTLDLLIRKWALWLSWSYCLFFSISMMLSLALDDESPTQNSLYELLNDSLSLLAILIIAYAGYRYGILYPLPKNKNAIAGADENLHYYQGLYHKINLLVDEQQLYLKSDLTMTELCKRLSINQKYFSQAINLCHGSGFSQFINEKRIAAFESKIADPQYKNYSLAALSHECGFSSSSSFNRVFKSMRGMTPSAYLESKTVV